MVGPIYFDHNATTPLDPRVVEAVVDALRANFGNAASRHETGGLAHTAVQDARRSVAKLIGADPEDVVFTSGATESNNLVLWGSAARRGDRRNLVTSEIEHPSILEPAEAVAADGVVVRRVRPDNAGVIDPTNVGSLVDDETFLVSLMLANNEVGNDQSRSDVRAAGARGGSVAPLRRHTSRRSRTRRRGGARRRFHVVVRAQVLWTEGNRRTLCAEAGASTHRTAHVGRRA